MAKNRRGKLIKATPGWRGTCPVCGRPRVKLVWEKNKVKMCKLCFTRASK